MYVVIKRGIYIQGVYGPYEDEVRATLKARHFAGEDSDNYHEWEVYNLAIVNEPKHPQRPWYDRDGDDAGLGDILFSIRKA